MSWAVIAWRVRLVVGCWTLLGLAYESAAESPAVSVPRTLDLYIPTPDDNRLSPDRIELGQKLFFEKLLSRDKTLSCHSCHEPERSFTVGGVRNPHLDQEIRPLGLTDNEKKDLVAFLESLTGNILFERGGDSGPRTEDRVRSRK